MLVPGCSIASSKSSLELAAESCPEGNFAKVFATAGIHPYYVPPLEELEVSIVAIESLVAEFPCVAIGECGLDASDGFPTMERQRPFFSSQVELATRLSLPIFAHERGCFKDFVTILQGFGYGSDTSLPLVVVHCFTGNIEELNVYVSLGFYIGITGYILRKNDDNVDGLLAALSRRVVPLDRLMIETDAPYMGFKGCRKRWPQASRTFPNVPDALPDILTKLAEVMNLPQEEVAAATTKNACQFFRIQSLPSTS
jgi:TatD DNase family protein